MSDTVYKVLIIDDDLGDRKHLLRAIGQSGLNCEAIAAESLAQAVRDHAEISFDFVILDNRLPDGLGIDLLERVQEIWFRAGIALATGGGSETLAAGAIKKGAVDYLSKTLISGPIIGRVIENGVRMARLKSSENAQRASLLRFSHALAHDLRSPLAAVRFVAEAMLTGVASQDEQEMRTCATLMVQYSDRLSGLIDSLQRYNSLDQSFEPVEAFAGDLLEGAKANLLSEIAANDALILSEPLPVILCYPPEIVRLFQNLLSNALKYRGERRPRIEIRTEPEPQSDRLVFTVEDNGIGIPANMRGVIFEEFKRLHAADKIAGTGLGLAMCRRIVERHSGRIWCEPGRAGGTQFRFTLQGLPRQTGQDGAQPGSAPESGPESGPA